jgi:bacteriochlorophyllide a dehydrogenase
LKAKAIVFTGVNKVELQTVEIPEPGPGEVLLEALYTLVSPGTELRCLAGKQEGASFPFIPGYSLSGRVIARGRETTIPEDTVVYCDGTKKSDIIRLWGGHISHAIQPERNVYPLPEGMNPLGGAAAHVAGIAYRGVRLGQPKPHERVAVIGLGAIGTLAARLHALSGAYVAAADLSPFRVSIARKAGIDAFTPQGDLAESFRRLQPGGADLVVDATGRPEIFPLAIEVAKSKEWDDSAEPGARLIVQGSYAGDFSVPYNSAFMKEISIHVSRDVQPRDVHAVLDLMKRKKINPEDIISDVRTPDSARQTYESLADPNGELITVAFIWS